MNIFIVDDDDVFKLVAKKLFERIPMVLDIKFAGNGIEAIEHLNNIIAHDSATFPDILLLDIDMPLMNGWGFMDEFIKFPRKYQQQISIYILSSSNIDLDKKKAASYPQIRAYLTKPLTFKMVNDLLLNEY